MRIIKLFICISIIFSLFSFTYNSSCISYNYNKHDNLNNKAVLNEEYLDDKYNTYFDFGDNIVSSENIIICNLYDNFFKESVLNYDGNIVIDVLYSEVNYKKLKIILPDYDTETLITLSCENDNTSIILYSSKNLQYGVSTISLFNAWSLVNKIPNQNLMDNDEAEATYQEIIDEADSSIINRSSGGVYGYLRWTDDDNNTHPLIGVKVKLTFVGIQGIYTYTDSLGFFQLYFSNMVGNPTIHIYPENAMVAVKFKVSEDVTQLYEKVEYLSNFNNSNYNYGTYTFNTTQDSDLARAMQIFSAMKNYSDYAASLNGDLIDLCNVIYPNSASNCYYDNNGNIFLRNESANQLISVAGSWDVIGHEYGHHLQKLFFNQNYYGSHSSYYSCIENHLFSSGNSYSSPLTFEEKSTVKDKGCGLGLKESWPTFFAISAQDTFSNDIKLVDTVGDSHYESYNGVNYDLATLNFDRIKGESSEYLIMVLLYHLWDSNNSESWDNFTISDEDLWNLIYDNNPKYLSELINLIYTELNIDLNTLGLFLEHLKLSASNLTITQDNSNYAINPSFSWIKNRYNVTYNSHTYSYGNDMFTLEFYDVNYNFIFKKEYISSNNSTVNYTLSNAEWNLLLDLSSNTYYVRIISYATLGFTTGPYYSHYYQFSKPNTSTASCSITLNNSRYYERNISIIAGTAWRFNTTFDRSGNKLIQTFGEKDTLMKIYDSDGTTLLYSNYSDGYEDNAFIYAYLLSNKVYVIELSYYSNLESGQTKLSIISVGGFINSTPPANPSYEDIYNVDSQGLIIYNSYVTQYNSMIITWTPSTSGYYYISLDSNFDNYLYVINPNSASELIENVDYNDDEYYNDPDDYELNALLYGYYSSDVTYLIVFSQTNPSLALNSNNISITISNN